MVLKEIPDVKLRIVGKCKDEKFLEELNRLENVKAVGYVEDVANEYENCGIVIVPVYQGAGTSVKFVEGLMTNRPIVTTSLGARGYDHICRKGIDYLAANDDDEFARSVIGLLQNVDLARSVSSYARQTGEKYFSQEHFMSIVKNEIKKYCDETAR